MNYLCESLSLSFIHPTKSKELNDFRITLHIIIRINMWYGFC